MNKKRVSFILIILFIYTITVPTILFAAELENNLENAISALETEDIPYQLILREDFADEVTDIKCKKEDCENVLLLGVELNSNKNKKLHKRDISPFFKESDNNQPIFPYLKRREQLDINGVTNNLNSHFIEKIKGLEEYNSLILLSDFSGLNSSKQLPSGGFLLPEDASCKKLREDLDEIYSRLERGKSLSNIKFSQYTNQLENYRKLFCHDRVLSYISLVEQFKGHDLLHLNLSGNFENIKSVHNTTSANNKFLLFTDIEISPDLIEATTDFPYFTDFTEKNMKRNVSSIIEDSKATSRTLLEKLKDSSVCDLDKDKNYQITLNELYSALELDKDGSQEIKNIYEKENIPHFWKELEYLIGESENNHRLFKDKKDLTKYRGTTNNAFEYIVVLNLKEEDCDINEPEQSNEAIAVLNSSPYILGLPGSTEEESEQNYNSHLASLNITEDQLYNVQDDIPADLIGTLPEEIDSAGPAISEPLSSSQPKTVPVIKEAILPEEEEEPAIDSNDDSQPKAVLAILPTEEIKTKDKKDIDSLSISQAGIDFIKTQEVYKAYSKEPYLDGTECVENDGKKTCHNLYSIGYGHQLTPQEYSIYKTRNITQEEANRFLNEDVSKFETAINNRVTTPITQEQFDSLISFTYTVGINNFKNSTLLKKINSKASNSEVAYEYSRWIYQTKIYNKKSDIPKDAKDIKEYAGYWTAKIPLNGLIKRRKLEGAVWS